MLNSSNSQKNFVPPKNLSNFSRTPDTPPVLEEVYHVDTLMDKVLGKAPINDKTASLKILAAHAGSKWELDEILPKLISKKIATGLILGFLQDFIDDKGLVDAKTFEVLVSWLLDRLTEKANHEKAMNALTYCLGCVGPKTYMETLTEALFDDKRFASKQADKFIDFATSILTFLKIEWTGLIPWIQIYRGFFYLYTISSVEGLLARYVYIMKQKLGSHWFLLMEEFTGTKSASDNEQDSDFGVMEATEDNFIGPGLEEFRKYNPLDFGIELMIETDFNDDINTSSVTRNSTQVTLENEYPKNYRIRIPDFSKELTTILKSKTANQKVQFESLKTFLLRNFRGVVKRPEVTELALNFFAIGMSDSNKQMQKHSTQFCALFFRITTCSYKVSPKFTMGLPQLCKDKNSSTREEAIFC